MTDLLEGYVPGIRSDTLADIVSLSGVNMIIRLEIAGEFPGSGGQDVFTDNSKSMYALGLSHHTGGNL